MDYRRGKPPLVTLHIPLLTLGAWQQGYFKECRFVQDLGGIVEAGAKCPTRWVEIPL